MWFESKVASIFSTVGGEHFDTEDVVKGIDTNVRGLKKSEARYYTFSISPSGDEIAHLRRTIADTRQALVDAGEDVPRYPLRTT